MSGARRPAASTRAPANASVHSATKASVDAVTRSLGKELGDRNIRVNAICARCRVPRLRRHAWITGETFVVAGGLR